MRVSIDKVKVNGETIYIVSCPDVVRYPMYFHILVDALNFVKSVL